MLSILHDVAHDASSKAAVISPISSPEEPRQPQEAERLEKATCCGESGVSGLRAPLLSGFPNMPAS
jgi:hypothetical protein